MHRLEESHAARTVIPVPEYDLNATLDSGQAFGWSFRDGVWFGVVRGRWVGLRAVDHGIAVETTLPQASWDWLVDYLQTRVDFPAALEDFPADPPLQEAVRRHRGLRLLRQDPWECLASFLLSATKRIVQIQRVFHALCERFGRPLATPPGYPRAHQFPSAHTLAEAGEASLRQCGMGFRARYLHETAHRVTAGQFDPSALRGLSLPEARERLLSLPGVGPKIADCVLLFSGDQPGAFPIDVWVSRALRRRYFGDRRVSLSRLRTFASSHFGPRAGYAQQYLFHDARRQPHAPAEAGHVAR